MEIEPLPGELWLRRKDTQQVIVVEDPAGPSHGRATVAYRALPSGRLTRTDATTWERKFSFLAHDRESFGDREPDQLRALLLGRRIVGVGRSNACAWGEQDTLILDSGVELTVHANNGCSHCGAGAYWIDRIVPFDNAITRVEFPCRDTSGLPGTDGDEELQITVYAGGLSTPGATVLTVHGNDDNGYYGTGFSISVSLPKQD